MAQIIVGDVLEEFEVKNTSGELIGTIRFNPADPGMVNRYEEIVKKMESIDTTQGESDFDFYNRVAEEIKDMIDYVLGQKCADVFFSVAHPLAVLENGTLYCESVLAGIAEAIEKATGERVKRIKAKVNKYAKKYHK